MKEKRKYNKTGLHTKEAKAKDTMPDDMVQRIVRNSQEHIQVLRKSKEDFQEQYEKDKSFFEEAKAIFEKSEAKMNAIDSEIAEENGLIELMNRFKKADPNSKRNKNRQENKEIVQSSKGNRYNMDWLGEAEVVLRAQYSFMTVSDLYYAIVGKPEIYEKVKEAASFKNNKMRGSFIKTATAHAILVTGGKKKSLKFHPSLYLYKGLLGLPEWIDSKGVPNDAKLMKPFMFAASKQEQQGTVPTN